MPLKTTLDKSRKRRLSINDIESEKLNDSKPKKQKIQHVGTTLEVNKQEKNKFKSITDALHHANAFDKIVVHEGML